MFLGTNEFYWQVNTDLAPIDIDDIKKQIAESNQGKKTKALWEAYQVAAEEHDLAYFKSLLVEHERAVQEDIEEKAKHDAEKASKKEKKDKRKSKGKETVDEDEDVEMEDVEDADAGKKAKGSKKRKKEPDSDDEAAAKPAKTPKTKLKVNGPKAPTEESATKPKKASKPKKVTKPKGDSDGDNAETPTAEEPVNEKDRLAKRGKQVLWLRHKLQKGFLTRDQAPKEEEMSAMADHFNQLEEYTDLEPSIIRETKIHKVLKAILKLNSIPKDEEFKFKQRSTELLAKWNKALAGDSGEATNGVKHDDEEKTGTKSPEATALAEGENKADEAERDEEKRTESVEAPVETAESGNEAKDDEDVSMADAPKDDVPSAPAESEAPAAEKSKEGVAAAA